MTDRGYAMIAAWDAEAWDVVYEFSRDHFTSESCDRCGTTNPVATRNGRWRYFYRRGTAVEYKFYVCMPCWTELLELDPNTDQLLTFV